MLAHHVTRAFLYQVVTASQPLKMTLTAKIETQLLVNAWNATMHTGSMEQNALLSIHFAHLPTFKTVNVFHVTQATPLWVEAVESLLRIPTVRNTITLPTFVIDALSDTFTTK